MRDSCTSIIIPVRNRREITLRCLSLLAWTQDQRDWRIIVVDDASSDGTPEAIQAAFPHVQVIHGSGELYWTGGIVLGMQRAIELASDVLIWLNDDALPNEASMRRLSYNVRSHPDWIIAATYYFEGHVINMNSLRRHAAPVTGAEFDDADMVAGNLVAFSSRVVEAIGYPDAQRCPHVAGDGTYTYTAHQHGFRVKVDSQSRLDLVNYAQYPSVADYFWSGSHTMQQRIEATFLAKRSRYRLATQWYLDQILHGSLKACLVFPARLSIWLSQIVRHRIVRD